MSAGSLADALAALEKAAHEAGVDADTARREGEAMAATLSERSRGAFVDWCEQTGREQSAEEHQLAAKQGNRFRGGPTPLMGQLMAAGSPGVDGYRNALEAVATAALTLGEPSPDAAGAAVIVLAAQRGTTAPPPLDSAPAPEPAVGMMKQLLDEAMEQAAKVQRTLTNQDLVDTPRRWLRKAHHPLLRNLLNHRLTRSRPSPRCRRRPSTSCSPSSTSWSA